jgi:hypothetical protein
MITHYTFSAFAAIAAGACFGTAAGLSTRSIWVGFLVATGTVLLKIF